MARQLLYRAVMYKLALMLVGACGFQPSEAVQPDARTGDATPRTGSCSVDDPAVKLCLDFEDPSLALAARDLSAGAHDGSTSLVSLMTNQTEQAARFTSVSSIHIARTADLDFTGSFAIEMQLDPMTNPGDSYTFHNADQYGLGIVGTNVYCTARGAITPTTATSGNLVANGAFQHVACSFDGATLRTYIAGAQVSCVNVTSNALGGTSGTEIGSGFMGGIDNVHVYERALLSTEIASLAGLVQVPDLPTTDCF